MALPARLLLDTLKTFPEQPLTFLKTEKNTVEISANNGKYAIAYAGGEEFPKAPQVNDSKTIQIKRGPWRQKAIIQCKKRFSFLHKAEIRLISSGS